MQLKNDLTQKSSPKAWGGKSNLTRKGREAGIPPSIEHLMLWVNNSLNGVPPFFYSDVGKVIQPPVTRGLKQLPEGVNKTVVVIGAGLGGLISALELAKLGYKVKSYQ